MKDKPQTTDLSQEYHCVWQENDDGQYEACGENIFTIISGTPSENGMKFCCYCSYSIEERPYKPSANEEKVRHRCSACLRDFSSYGSCIVHIGNYHSEGGIGEFVPQAYPIRKD